MGEERGAACAARPWPGKRTRNAPSSSDHQALSAAASLDPPSLKGNLVAVVVTRPPLTDAAGAIAAEWPQPLHAHWQQAHSGGGGSAALPTRSWGMLWLAIHLSRHGPSIAIRPCLPSTGWDRA